MKSFVVKVIKTYIIVAQDEKGARQLVTWSKQPEEQAQVALYSTYVEATEQ